MKILIANPGSTSFKCKLLDMDLDKTLFSATIERIGDQEGICTFEWQGDDPVVEHMAIADYPAALQLTLDNLSKRMSVDDVAAIGFKTVLAKDVSGCVELTDDVLTAMEDYLPLAPVHNRVYLDVIYAFKQVTSLPLVALFETSFHTEIPPEAFLYGIPYRYYEKYGIRKYGFHGASHRYISEYTAANLAGGRTDITVISCHLGGSSSVSAIRNGVCVDTSMGMSPQSGLLNAKRNGDLDTFALLYLMEREQLSIDQARSMLISEGGVLGISELSADFRDIEAAMDQGNEKACIAFNTFCYYVRRYIGEYLAVLNGADYIVFTAGMGENQPRVRTEIIKNMENLGIRIDEQKNAQNSEIISAADSRTTVAVVPTNEEKIVARSVREFMENR